MIKDVLFYLIYCLNFNVGIHCPVFYVKNGKVNPKWIDISLLDLLGNSISKRLAIKRTDK